MTEYIVILLLLLISFIFKRNRIVIYTTAAYMLFIGMFRDFSVGTDIQYYYNNFKYINFNPKSWNAGTYFEPGFNVLTLFIKNYVSKDYMTYISLLFLYTFSITFCFFLKYSKDLSLSLYSFYTFGTYFIFMNAMRQSFAFATCLIILHLYIQKKNKILYIINILLATILFHNSMLIFLLIPFLNIIYKKVNISKRKLYFFLIGSFLISTIFQDVLRNALNSFAFLFGRFSGYILNSQEQGRTTSLAYTLLGIFCVYFCKNIKGKFFMIYILGIIIYNFFGIFSTFSFRIALPFLFLSAICYSNISVVLPRKDKIIFNLTIMLLGFIYFYYSYIIKGYQEVYPYVQRNINFIL